MPAEPRLAPPVVPARWQREGFAGQTLVVLPEKAARDAARSPLLRGLLPVAAGFFPSAAGHLVVRTRPIADAIVILCTAGRGWVQVGAGKRGLAEPDTLVCIPPGEPHAYGADDAEPWSIHWAHFRGDLAAEFIRLFGVMSASPVVALPPGAADAVGAVEFAEIHARLAEDYTLPNLLSAAARLRLALMELHRLRSAPGAARGKPADPIEGAVAWMREHTAAQVSLSALARRAGLSVSQFSLRFRRRVGYSPVDYFLRLKVQCACRLLDATPMRVEEVAAAVGYDDAFYFSRQFRRIMGQSPRAYRAAAKG